MAELGHMVSGMGKPTSMTGSWQELRKCRALTPKQADDLFFPGPGKKVTKAQKYCDNGCPVQKECLELALRLKLNGFWAGTTDADRESMKDMFGSLSVTVLDFLPRSVREREEGKVTRRPPQPAPYRNPLADPLAGLEGPSDADLRLMA